MNATIHQTKILNTLIEIASQINCSLNYQKVVFNCLNSLKSKKISFTEFHKIKQRRGEPTKNGTIFVDEIADIFLTIQINLLKFLQNHCFERLTSNKMIPRKPRIIFVTNANIEENIQNKTWKKNFYYRLIIFLTTFPSLKKRLENFPLLIHHFIKIRSI